MNCPYPRSGRALPDGDGFAQAVQWSFQVGHALAQFGDLLLQGRKPLVKILTLGRLVRLRDSWRCSADSRRWAADSRRWAASSVRMAR